MKIYIGNIKEYSTEYLKTFVAKERIISSMKYRFDDDRKRSLLAHALLNRAVSEIYPDKPLPVMPVADEYGKPHLFIDNREFHFSISHSGDYAVCAINDSPVGVDIETIGKGGDSIANHFFAKAELKYIRDAESFYHIWTLKESFLKVVGLGMKLPLDHFVITDYDRNTGLCRYVLNESVTDKTDKIGNVSNRLGLKEEGHRRSDAPKHGNLIPFIKPGTDEFTVLGKCMTYDASYSLAAAAVALSSNDINIIRCRF